MPKYLLPIEKAMLLKKDKNITSWKYILPEGKVLVELKKELKSLKEYLVE